MDRAAPLSGTHRRLRIVTAIGALLVLLGTYLVSATGQADAAPTRADRADAAPDRANGDFGTNVIRVAEFPADCTYSHRLPDDPIIFPGLPGHRTCTASSAAR